MLGEWSGTGSEPWYDDNGGKHRRCNMAPPRAAAYSELTNGRDQSRLVANPSMSNTHRSTTWLPESAKDEH